MVSRLVDQKGFDLIEKAFDNLMERPIQFVLLGTGEKHYHDFLSLLPQRYPGRVGIKISFSEEISHRIIAGADIFLMPSRYEPGGLTQVYSLKYGTVPIARATGGLKDTVLDFVTVTGNGNGFLFVDYTVTGLLAAVDRAISHYGKPEWPLLMKNGMACDFSWQRSAREYLALYQSLSGLPTNKLI
jgi:starch synthase